MIDDMPRPRPPHLRHETTRHGKRLWYVRFTRTGRRTRLKADYGTGEFWRQYHSAIAGELASAPKTTAPNGSLEWLIERYRQTTSWADLAPATRRNRENHFKQVLKTAGLQPYRSITQAVIIVGRIQGSVREGRHSEQVGAWLQEDRRDQSSREWGDRGRAQRDLRLDGYGDGLSLYRGGGSQAARARLDAQDGERN